MESKDLVEKVITEVDDKQVRWVISEFREKHYLSIRKYFESFEGDWCPTKDGITMPYDLQTTARLWIAFVDLLAEAEVLDEVMKHAEELRNAN